MHMELRKSLLSSESTVGASGDVRLGSKAGVQEWAIDYYLSQKRDFFKKKQGKFIKSG